jgi:hypothetical protein
MPNSKGDPELISSPELTRPSHTIVPESTGLYPNEKRQSHFHPTAGAPEGYHDANGIPMMGNAWICVYDPQLDPNVQSACAKKGDIKRRINGGSQLQPDLPLIDPRSPRDHAIRLSRSPRFWNKILISTEISVRPFITHQHPRIVTPTIINEATDDSQTHFNVCQSIQLPRRLQVEDSAQILPTFVTVSNLDLKQTSAQVRALFEECGSIIYTRLEMHPRTGQSLGIAHIKFQTVEAVQICVARFHGRYLAGGDELIVEPDVNGGFSNFLCFTFMVYFCILDK